MVELSQFRRLIEVPDAAVLGRYFTASETDAAGQGEVRLERLAGRFAVKEAVLKALGVGWGDGVAFTDVEVINDPLGQPSVVLRRELATLARGRGVDKWLVSTTHTASSAFASVVAIGLSEN